MTRTVGCFALTLCKLPDTRNNWNYSLCARVSVAKHLKSLTSRHISLVLIISSLNVLTCTMTFLGEVSKFAKSCNLVYVSRADIHRCVYWFKKLLHGDIFKCGRNSSLYNAEWWRFSWWSLCCQFSFWCKGPKEFLLLKVRSLKLQFLAICVFDSFPLWVPALLPERLL